MYRTYEKKSLKGSALSNKDGRSIGFDISENIIPVCFIFCNQSWIGKDNRIHVFVIPGKSSNQSLQDGIHVWFFGVALVQDPQVVLGQGFGATQLFFDKDKGMFVRFDMEKIVKFNVHFREERGIGKDLAKVEDGDIMKIRMRGSYNMRARIFRKERFEFPYVVKCVRIDGIRRGVFPGNLGVIRRKRSTYIFIL